MMAATTSPTTVQATDIPSSSASNSASSTSKRDSRSTIDALTTSLRESSVKDLQTSSRFEIDAKRFKGILLHPLENDTEGKVGTPLPSLTTIIHDRVWSQGGEHVFLLGELSDVYGELDRSAPAEVEHVEISFTSAELDQSIKHLSIAAQRARCTINVLRRRVGEGTAGSSAFLLVRRIPENAQELLELRIAVVGNGKCASLL